MSHCEWCGFEGVDIRHFVRAEPDGHQTILAMCWGCRMAVERDMGYDDYDWDYYCDLGYDDLDYYCDLCANDEHRPITEDWVSPKGRLFGFLCTKCQEFVIEREAMTPEQLAREAASIRAYQEEMRRFEPEGES